jgi:alpha-mannosidase
MLQAAPMKAQAGPAPRALKPEVQRLLQRETGRLVSATTAALPGWRYKVGHTKGAERGDFDDSKWKSGDPEFTWGEEHTCWLRREIVTPQKIGNFPVAGLPLVLQLRVDDEGEVFLNGQPAGKVGIHEGSVALPEMAQPGRKLVVAVKGLNKQGPGRLLTARLALQPVVEPGCDLEEYLADLAAAGELLAAATGGKDKVEAALKAALAAIDAKALEAGDLPAFLRSLARSRKEMGALRPVFKRYQCFLCGHAHIDMNWLWLWPETVDVCVRTFTQALRFMNEFPEFRFSQSQASTYVAVEEARPSLMEEIGRRVKERRWEITGGTWVEGDMNMASGEAIVRQVLYAKRYFREKFGVDVRICWEPDTFGHAWTVPQILKRAGIDYYYFCRCGKGQPLFWWEGPDGSRVLAYNRGGYGDKITPRIGRAPFEVEEKVGVKDAMIVYGVGDHGGGPTRVDIESALDLQKRPFFPTVKFSRVVDFFDAAAKAAKEIPVIRDEINFVFEGCYTTHADVKRMNRESENLLPAAEAFAAIAAAHGGGYPKADFVSAWRDTCFNQFHDIFDGSAIHGSYDYSRRLFEKIKAVADRSVDGSLKALCARINTQGAGAPVVVFNPLAWERDDVVAVDLPLNPFMPHPTEAIDASGEATPVQVIERWGAPATILFVARKVPAMGYKVYHLRPGRTPQGGVKVDDSGLMESDRYRIQVDRADGCITSIYDKTNGREVLPKGAKANLLQALYEDPHEMSAWNIGKITKTEDLTSTTQVEIVERGPVRALARVTRKFRKSSFTQDVALYLGLPRIDLPMTADWRELGSEMADAPMIKVAFPLNAAQTQATYEIPFGSIARPTNGHEVPAQKWADLSEVKTEPLEGQAAEFKPVDLSPFFNQDAVSSNKHRKDAALREMGWAYPAEEFPAPGEQEIGGVPFIIPSVADGQKNAICCEGQEVPLPAGRFATLCVLGACHNGSFNESAVLIFSDGSRQMVQLGLSDWCHSPAFGEAPGLAFTHRHRGGGDDVPPPNIRLQKIALPQGKELKAIVLPTRKEMHVFALTLAPAMKQTPIYGISLLNDCKYGYDASDNVLRLTLLRSSYQPDPKPDEGAHHMTYSIVAHKGDWREGDTVRRGYELNNPLIARVEKAHGGGLPPARSFVEVGPSNLIVTALKQSEDGDDLILRFYESQGKAVTATIRTALPFKSAVETNLLEQESGGGIRTDGKTISLSVKPWEIRTIRLRRD